MKKRSIVITIVLGLAGLAAAQVSPQNIINSKVSEGCFALSLTEGATPADVLRQDNSLGTNHENIVHRQNAKEHNITKILAGLSQSRKSNACLPQKGSETRTRNIRRVYN